VLTDERELENKEELIGAGIIVYDGGFANELLTMDFDWVVKNPGVPEHHPFVIEMAKRHFIANELEFAQRFIAKWKLGAITGTNGKTTTTAMLAEIFRKNSRYGFAAGNIGIPLCDIVRKQRQKKVGYGAIEIAAFQLVNTKKFHPHVATIVSLAPDHLDVFKDEKAYYDAKWKIVENLTADDYFVLNIDDPIILKTKKDTVAKVITVSQKMDADVSIINNKAMIDKKVLFDLNKLHVVGKHNVTNAMIAAAMAYAMEFKPKQIAKALHSFMGVEHRIEFVDEVKGVRYYNDSKGTNPQSTRVALEAFNQPVILLAGGYDKKITFDELVEAKDKIQDIVVFGQTKDILKETFEQAYVVNNLEQAINKAVEISKPGDVICLSPACASYDQYKNFEERGKQFKALVMALRKDD
jgi:UDP-N-acetylmuramoylalanine--D-glutamate ligase